MNEQLQAQLADILKAMQGAAAEYGPKALQLALEVRRWDAIGTIVLGLLLLAFGLFVASHVKRLWKNDGPAEIGAPLGVLTLCLWVAAGFYLLNIWNWVGVFRPEIALARDLLVKITN